MKTTPKLSCFFALLMGLLWGSAGATAFAAPGDVEVSFNPNADADVYSTALQADGKIVIMGVFSSLGGGARLRLARLNPDGTLDTGFSAAANAQVNCALVQADQRILIGGGFSNVGGVTRLNFARLNADGTLENGFNPGVDDVVHSAAMQADGKLVIGGGFTNVGGVTRNYIARINTNGTLDAGFNPNANNPVVNTAVQADGKLVIVGSFTTVGGTARNYIARINTNGTVDAGFNPDANEVARGTVVQADGKLVIVGGFTAVGGTARNYIVRLNTNGTVDAGFNPNANDVVFSTALQADGKIVIVGRFTTVGGVGRNRLARLNADGTVDTGFNPNADNSVYSTALQADGKILVGGAFTNLGGLPRNYFARLENDVATQSLTAPSTSRLQWLRGGASPEAQDVTFELSTNGGNSWTPLGTGTRISGGWELTGLGLPAICMVRASARITSGIYNRSGGLVETVASFSGLSPFPFITTHPQNQIATASSNAVFSVFAVGAEPLFFQWLRNGNSVAGATNVALNIPNAQPANAGNYTVVVSNAFGSVTSQVAMLTVNVPLTVITWAGGSLLSTTNDGPRLSAGFYAPQGLAIDSADNLYVADVNNHTIRKITPTGVVITLAGTGWPPGFANGPSNEARFNLPYDVAVDTAGNVYVADKDNSAIRKITPTGLVSTLAAAAAPHGVAVDGAGNVYASESPTSIIRKIAPDGSSVILAGQTGVAGTNDGVGGAARFGIPAGLALDSATNLYVADLARNTIRKVTPDGTVTTLAGLGGIDTQGSSDGAGSTARFYNPWGIAVDAADNLYVADYSNHLLRRISPSGVVTTVAGFAGNQGTNDGIGAAVRFKYPGGVAVDSRGAVFIADTYNNRIRKGVYGPAAASPPQDQFVAAGSNVTFTVTALSSGPVGYQWRLNGVNIAGATSATYSFGNAQPANAGEYSVVLSNAFGMNTSQVATLTVETTFTRILSGPAVTSTNHSRGAAWADFNNDGRLDLIVANATEEFLYTNAGGGVLVSITNSPVVSAQDNSIGTAWGDIDNDGLLDLVVANNDIADRLFHNNGNGTFAEITSSPVHATTGHSSGTAWADYDGDGWLDLFVSAHEGSTNRLYHNNRDGTFTPVTSGPVVSHGGESEGCTWGDYDGDGRPDLFVAALGTNFLYHNLGGGVFMQVTNLAPVTTLLPGGSAAWGDFDNDGDLDLFVANFSGLPDALYRNDEGTNFVEVTIDMGLLAEETSFGCSWADFDNDGFLDLYVAAAGTNVLYHNTGMGMFERVLTGPIGTDTGTDFINGIWGDYDGDGFVDLFVTTYDGQPNRLYHNNGNSNAWVKVRCIGTASNRAAIGAKVRVLATIGRTNRWQMREISGGTGYGAQNDLVQLFGLGDATNIDVLRIEWPSGIVQTFSNVAPRQFLTIQEQTTFYFAVNGSGSVSYAPVQSNYFIGEPLTLTATPRNPNWTRFVRWSDGNTNATRSYAVGLSNVLTAVFTNVVALEELAFQQWQRTFGGTDVDRLTRMIATPDGGFLLGGYSYSSTNGNKTSTNWGNADYWVVKIDANGNKLWERSFGGSAEDILLGMNSTADGGYILAGESSSDASGNKANSRFGGADFWVIKIDAAGNKQWERSYGGSGTEGAYSVQQTTDGGYIIGGYSASTGGTGNKTAPNLGQHDIWIVKTDAEGNKQWDYSFGGGQPDGFGSIQQTTDGGYFIGGTFRDSPIASRFWAIKLDAGGGLQWERKLAGGNPGNSFDAVNSAAQLPDGGYFLGGYAQSGSGGDKSDPNFGSFDYWFVRLNPAGVPLWNHAFGGDGDDELSVAKLALDGGFLLAGFSGSNTNGNKLSPGFGGNDGWVVRLDPDGNKKWDFALGGSDDDYFKAIEVTADGYLLAGNSQSTNGNKTAPRYGASDYWVVKLLAREAPVGTPVVLVNGAYSPSNSFAIPATNVASVTLTSTYPGGYIYYSLDGVTPVPGEANTFEYSTPGNPGVPFVVSNSVVVLAVAYSSDETGNVPADADPVAIHIVPLYSLTNTTPGGGSVAMNPPGGVYLSNTVVTLTATPSNGWSFLRWEGAVTSTSNPLALTMDGAKTIRAVFGTGLTTTTNLAGTSVALWPPMGLYPYGSLVRLVGVPSAGNRFNRWFSNISGPTTNTLDFTVLTANTNIPAFFVALTGNNFTLTTLLNGSGTATRNPAANFYASNTTVTVTAVPDPGRVFTGWSGDANSAFSPLTLVMNTNKTVTANFTFPPTNVVITSPASGAGFFVPEVVPISVTASDADGSVSVLEVYANGRLLASSASSSLQFSWNNPLVGSYTLTARAVDQLGAAGTSAPVSITVTGRPPRITALVPPSGPTGSVLTITGTNFHPIASNNLVSFGGVRAVVQSSTPNTLQVRVPAGVTPAPLSVTVGGLSAYSRIPFNVTFQSGNVPAVFNEAIVFIDQGDSVYRRVLADFDGDGRLDIIVGSPSSTVTVYQNFGSPGSISSNAFVAFVLDYPQLLVDVADLDGDGRPDLIFENGIRKNLSLPGLLNIDAFGQFIGFPAGMSTSAGLTADYDQDGRPDLLWPGGGVLLNLSSAATIGSNSFTLVPVPEIYTDGSPYLAADVDGDGRTDLVWPKYEGSALNWSVKMARNISSPGAIAFTISTLTSTAGAYSLHNLELGDANADGKPDLFYGRSYNPPNGAQSGRYRHRNTSQPGSVSFDPSVSLIPGESRGPMSIVDMNGSGTNQVVLADSQLFTTTWGDIDGDGKLDQVYASFWNGYHHFLIARNTTPSSLPPVVSLTNPPPGAVFTMSETVALSASAGDSDGVVTNVSFFTGTSFIGSVTNGLPGTNPFIFTWTNAPVGGHSLTAVAMDNSGLSATSSPVNITVNATGNQPPLASLIAPTNGAVFAVGENITLTASAVDPDGSVARVEFYHGGANLIGIASNGVASQFSVVWSNAAVGTYSLTARAFDNLGAAGVSEARSVTVLLFGGPPAFRFQQAAYSVGEGETNVVLRVIRNFSSFATVNFATSDGSATAGADYDAAAGQLTFQPGVLVQTITNRILEDLVVEGSHTFSVTLSLPNGGGLASPSSAVVTIIDNDVQSGSSFLSIVPPPVVNTNDLGTLRVYLTGESGLGQWRLPWERSWRNSGTAAGGLQPGFYEIEFKPVSGHLPPPPATLAVSAAQETRSTNGYTILINTPAGSLTIFIDPPAVATNADPSCRGQWRVNGGAFQNSGATVSGLPAGGYAVEFKGLSESCGWSTPATRQAVVRPGVSNSFRVSYVTNVTGLEPITALTFNSIQNSYLNQQPFSFVGQITTEFGEASGVVVKERVVLTAAHVVFDDYSLAWAGNAQWFFQRHAPDYNPAPQEVRGYYVNGGYAAQREMEGTPGVSQTASFDLDVAALYFYEAAGRGGYGGYLVSDATTQWLQDGGPKALVGYPVEGIAPASLGKMHTVGPATMSFQQTTTTGAVFTCTQIRGLPGNSGGPLCVRYSGNNYFYPAGIYVGGSDRAIVRAIDSRAVNLINSAELTSNLGTNQTGGGVVRFGIQLPAGTCYQPAYVTIDPPAALAAGARWRVHYKVGDPALSPWTSSATYAIILNNKPDFLELADAEGFITPDPVNLSIGCTTTNLVFNYVQLLPRLDVLNNLHLILSGVTNRTYRVEYNGRVGTTSGWTPWTNISFPNNNSVAVISNALTPATTNRFFRAVRVP